MMNSLHQANSFESTNGAKEPRSQEIIYGIEEKLDIVQLIFSEIQYITSIN